MLKHRDKIQKIKKKKIEIPVVTSELGEWMLRIFDVLHSQRSTSDTPIQISEIKALMDLFEVPQYERYLLFRVIIYLDRVYFDNRPKESKSTKTPRRMPGAPR